MYKFTRPFNNPNNSPVNSTSILVVQKKFNKDRSNYCYININYKIDKLQHKSRLLLQKLVSLLTLKYTEFYALCIYNDIMQLQLYQNALRVIYLCKENSVKCLWETGRRFTFSGSVESLVSKSNSLFPIKN